MNLLLVNPLVPDTLNIELVDIIYVDDNAFDVVFQVAGAPSLVHIPNKVKVRKR